MCDPPDRTLQGQGGKNQMKTTVRFELRQVLVVALGIGAMIALAPSCSHPPPPMVCSADNCTGCCDDTGSCANGNTKDACGANGITCQTCNGTQSCAGTDGGTD